MDYKEIFNQVEECSKIGYDCMYSNDLEILQNFVKCNNKEYFFSIFLENGEIVCEICFKKHIIKSPAIMFLSFNTEFKFIDYSKDISLTFLVSNKGLRLNLLNNFSREVSVNQCLKTIPCKSLNEKGQTFISKHIGDIKQIFSDISNPYRLEALKYLLTSSYYQFFYQLYPPNEQNDYGICNNFFELIECNFIHQRNSNFYAQSMNVSKGHLEFIIKEKTGKTVKSWIDERIIEEAKRLLRETPLSIESISRNLQFSSIEVFSRFFKRVTGVSPSKFRR